MRLRARDAAGASAPADETADDATTAAPATTATTSGWLNATLRLRVLVFVAGIASLSLEMCASRLLGPWYGTSLVVWANIIGFFLIYLTVGYFLGGRVADRYPSPVLLGALTAVAAIATALIPIISGPILDWSESGLTTDNASVFFSSMVAVILLFAVPVILLGFVSPFAVRLSVKRLGTTGSKAGGLYALSTAGSILGAFLPVLVFIPNEGVRWALFATALALLAVSLLMLPLRVRAVSGGAGLFGALLLIPLLAPQIMGPLKSEPGLIYYKESLYNYIQVVRESDGTMELVLNEGQAIHSIYNPNQVLTGWYWDYFLAAPYFNPPPAAGQVHRMAIIGLAGGTIARQFTAVYGNVPIDGVEIDPAIVAAGRKYFAMTEPNLHVYTADGRTFMRVTHHTYDVVAIDAFEQPYIPFQLTTKEFFQEIRAHLSPNGVVVLNTGHTSHDYRLVQAFVNTLSLVFPSVYTFNVPNTFNTEVMATMRPTSLQTLASNLHQVPPDSLMSTVADEVLPVATVAHAQKGGIVFTDDQAPIEQITDQVLLNYIQQGS